MTLPPHASPSERKHETRVPLVYLDQSVWSTWEKGEYPPGVTGRLIELAEQGRFLMVISEWHVIETVKTVKEVLAPDQIQRRLNLARFMAQFPNLIGLRPTDDLLIQEVARAYAASQAKQLVADPGPLVPVGEIEDVVRRALSVNAGYVPKNRRDANVETGGRGSMGFSSWLDNEMDAVYQASFKAAQFGRERKRRPKTWITAVKERLTNDTLVNYLNGTVETLERRMFSLRLVLFRNKVGEYLGQVPGPLTFWRWLWASDFRGSSALDYRVAYESLLKPSGNRRPQANDGRDVEHSFAAPFVDVLVHEKGHAHFARQAAKKAGLPCQVFSGGLKANELVKVVRIIERF